MAGEIYQWNKCHIGLLEKVRHFCI